VWRDRADESIASDSDYATGLVRAIRRPNDPAAPARALDDVVSHPWGRDRRDWYEAAAQLEVVLELQAGFSVIAQVDLGAVPGLNRHELDNQGKLSELPAPYTAWCEGGTGNDDGRLEWDQPIQIEHEMQDHGPSLESNAASQRRPSPRWPSKTTVYQTAWFCSTGVGALSLQIRPA
jgi:hypothetical protein